VLLICQFGTSRSEIRSVVVCGLPLILQRQYVHFKNTTGHHPRGRKEPSRHPKSSLHRTLVVVSRRARPPTSHLLIFHLSIDAPSPLISVTPHPQNDVEEYLGGPDAAVERVLSAFQDALACVFPVTLTTREPFSYSFTLPLNPLPLAPSFLAAFCDVSVGSIAIWTAT
jgi:hypothetical protein